MRRLLGLLFALTAALAGRAEAEPELRVLQETAVVSLGPEGSAAVSVRVPLALHRPANVFRLYGPRPLTLRDRNRRRDLYRDTFLELATRSQLAPAPGAWDTLRRQWDRLGKTPPDLQLLRQALLAAPVSAAAGDATRLAAELSKEVAALPGYGHLTALSRALGKGEPSLELAEPVIQALQLRALATDQAEQRLLALGEALDVERAPADPAMRDGYRAARAEFDQVRQGVWPAIAAAVQRNQGRLLASAARQVVLSNLGFWALCGHMGWQGVESALNAEYRGQQAICTATVAGGLAEAAAREPRRLPLAVYAEYLLNYQLTEALKTGQVLGLKPAGGRTEGSWQIQFNGRCEELRKALGPA